MQLNQTITYTTYITPGHLTSSGTIIEGNITLPGLIPAYNDFTFTPLEVDMCGRIVGGGYINLLGGVYNPGSLYDQPYFESITLTPASDNSLFLSIKFTTKSSNAANNTPVILKFNTLSFIV